MLEATYHEDRAIWTIGKAEYTHMVGGLAFADPTQPSTAQHTICVAGRREGGEIHIIEGKSGYIDEVIKEAINLKDRYKLRRIYHSNQAPLIVERMQQTDGLTRYRKERLQYSTLTKYVNPPETWEFFTSYSNVAHLVPVNPLWDNEFTSCVQEWEQSVANKKIVLPKKWKELQRLVARPLKDSIKGSLLRSVVFASLPLLHYNPPRKVYLDEKQPRYPNISRRV